MLSSLCITYFVLRSHYMLSSPCASLPKVGWANWLSFPLLSLNAWTSLFWWSSQHLFSKSIFCKLNSQFKSQMSIGCSAVSPIVMCTEVSARVEKERECGKFVLICSTQLPLSFTTTGPSCRFRSLEVALCSLHCSSITFSVLQCIEVWSCLRFIHW